MMTEKMLSLVTCAILMTIWAGPVFLASAEASGSGPGTSPADKAVGVSMRVLWTVSGYVLGKAPAMAEQEAKAFLFKPLDIKEAEIVFNGQVCKGCDLPKRNGRRRPIPGRCLADYTADPGPR